MPSSSASRAAEFTPAQVAAARELLRRRRGRASLAGYANAIEIPGKPASEDPDEWLFKPVESAVAAHHALLCAAIERTAARRRGRLMVFMPPGSAKSTYASVVAPSYLMGKTPDRRIILASYGSDLARRHGRRARQVVKSPGFASLFGCELSSSTSAADEWALTNGSEYLAGGILSGITGNRAHGIIIDDPVKGREQADSPTIRAKTWDAYNDDLLTRLIPGGWVVLVQTRWHEDDLAGRILGKDYAGQSGIWKGTDGEDWEIINLPAQAEHRDDPLGRQAGAYLWPEWFDVGHWESFKRQSRTWAALFQQRPRPDEGGIFNEAWCRSRWRQVPLEARLVVHSWDTAQKEADHNDPSALTVWNLGRGSPGYHLREVFADRIAYPTLRRKVIAYAERDKPIAILIEDKSSGQSLIQDLRSSTTLPIIPIEPDKNKIFRAMEVSAMVEAGLVHLPAADAPGVGDWLVDFEGEFFGFPITTHDDRVDSVTQFLRWVRNWDGRLEFAGAGLTRTLAEQMAAADDDAGGGWGSVGRGGADLDGFN
jgi:predicted phage terminase large subunit-like protein